MTELKYTDLELIPGKIDAAIKFYKDRQVRLSKSKKPLNEDIDERIRTLQKLYWTIKDHEEDFVTAAFKDYHRSRNETINIELVPLYNAILELIERVPKEIKPKTLKVGTMTHRFGKTVLEKIALGTVLLISPFNFPILLALEPLAGAIACGNSLIFKPSELTPECAKLMEKVCQETFEPGQVETVQGSIDETTVLLDSGKFDKIFYTGSPAVGAIIAEKAGKSLTPCVLELGGKSPVFVTKNMPKSKLDTAVRRIFFGSFGNSGQICVAPDYVLCHESIYEEFVASCEKILKEFFPSISSETEYTHLIHEGAVERINTVLDSTKGQKIIAGHSEKLPARCIPPILLTNVSWDDASMQGENFGPILPIMKYFDLDEAIDNVVSKHDTPLVQYIFSSSTNEVDHISTRIRSGACVVGDTIIHVVIPEAPFGGVGNSGYGSYHGSYTFRAFTHERTVFKQPFWVDFLLNVRYPPFASSKTKIMRATMENKPNFDRNGCKTYSLKIIGLMILSSVFLGFYLTGESNGLD
ncbi:unnamed protein product [Kluyveromyces dobzhanskii CBS 2104]|uniref:Aldehyde dehydrogenase n=1 Tax=Kluyveromyces dobzhanskii CBS 2104 TaxID=1427455 RepID=A0A0A8LAI3_9SACH|nr:unnamed protein product [Kluyveromyces dobzhanskii CBS 2104]